jgi:hypothetical protein
MGIGGDRVLPVTGSNELLCSANPESGPSPAHTFPPRRLATGRADRQAGHWWRSSYGAHAIALVIDPSKSPPRKPCVSRKERPCLLITCI